MIDYNEFDTENDRLIYKTSQIAEVAMGKMTISLLLWLCCCLPLEAAALRIAVNDAPPYRIVNPPFFGGYYIELIQAASWLAWNYNLSAFRSNAPSRCWKTVKPI